MKSLLLIIHLSICKKLEETNTHCALDSLIVVDKEIKNSEMV